jgi:uncharacterized protein (TIGR02466 family)
MQLPILFGTPLWHFRETLPKSAYQWAIRYAKKNPESVVKSNRGGYQSIQQSIDVLPYKDYLYKTLIDNFHPFEEFRIDGWWLNINERGNYNIPHTHPATDLAGIWYITDNEGLLYFQDPLITTRSNIYERIYSNWNETCNKSMRCSAGDILIFPSDVPHSVEEHKLNTPRISVSFNMLAKF